MSQGSNVERVQLVSEQGEPLNIVPAQSGRPASLQIDNRESSQLLALIWLELLRINGQDGRKR